MNKKITDMNNNADQLKSITPDPTRRRLIKTITGAAVLPLFSDLARSQSIPDDISTVASSRDWSGNNPIRYPDPDIITLDPSFRRCLQFNSPILRLHTGTLWAEGPAWNGVGRFLVWSDIPNNQQMRWIEDDARVTSFRSPSGNSNGNTFDFQGRQLSAEHGGRRVVRYEQNGSITIIADSYDGKRLNSPNDLVVHPDGSIWFTDPSFGIRGLYEGNPAESELKEAVYRVDGSNGRIEVLTDEVGQPNGLCFSPDYSRLYVADSGQTKVWDIDGTRLRNGRTFAQITLPDGGRSAPDGIRCDSFGNVWAGANPGVMVLSPEGDPIGMIRLPEICANVCFGGPKRNRLFMTASQSLYSLYLAIPGAHIC
ncbi:MAG: SMP-30/gluconolactonase/LRE family protein [Pseudohongiellaceae bacterium]